MSYKNQTIIRVIIITACFILGTVTGRGKFFNLGFVIIGLSYIVFPILPEKFERTKNNIVKVRISGVILLLVGLITRFSL